MSLIKQIPNQPNVLQKMSRRYNKFITKTTLYTHIPPKRKRA
jgi:hypothetical protein